MTLSSPYTFPGVSILFLDRRELLRAAIAGSLKLGERVSEITWVFSDTPKGDLLKKKSYFYEERSGKKISFHILRDGVRSTLSEAPDEFSEGCFPFIEVSGKKRRGRIRLKTGSSAIVEYLFNLKAKNPFFEKNMSLKNSFALFGTIEEAGTPDIGEKLGFDSALADLEIPFIHDADRSGFSILESDDCGTALRKLIRRELYRIKGFSHFTKAGLHPEYLHELRVAIRRLRSYLRIYPAVLGEKRSSSLGLAASSFGVDLGRLRDLDVFREKLTGWLAETGIPPEMTGRILEPFAAAAKEESEIVSRILGSRKFRDFVERIENFSRERNCVGTGSLEPYVEASLVAMKLYRNETRKRARKYFSTSDPMDLHRVRISFKRFRYLFESLDYLFDEEAEAFRSYRRVLVGIQDCLGNYQDIRVAGRLIDEALEKTEDKGTLVALGGLKQLLKTRQAEEERNFLKIFREFRKMKEPRIRKRRIA